MSERNGHTLSYPELREQIRCAKARRTLRDLELQERVAARLAPLTEDFGSFTGTGFGDFVDPMDAFRDPDLKGFQSPFISAGAGRYDRQDGKNRPFVWWDIDLDWMRSQARWLATRNPLAVGALDCLGDYTVRGGYDYESRPKKDYLQDATALQLARLVQEVVEDTESANSLDDDDGEETVVWADRERQAVLDSVVNGDVFIRGFDQGAAGDGTTLLRFVEAEQVRKPIGSRVEWDFGIHTPRRDIERRKGYAVAYGHPDDWEEVAAREMAHLKMNVPACVKRGISDFYCTAEMLDSTWKLLRNLAIVGCVQSAIPWIEQFESASQTQIDAFVKGKVDSGRPQITSPLTGRPSNFRRYQPGEIPHITRGRTYLPQPQAQNAPNHVAVVQAAMRSLGSRWRMPEYMISGDASNANYASTLVAGSPFVIRTECRQAQYGRFFVRVMWMAVRNAARAGRFQVGGRVYGWREVARYVDIVATPPQVAIANPAEEAQIDHADMDRGVLSIQTRQARRSLDSEQERRNLAEMPLPGKGQPGQPPPGQGQQDGSPAGDGPAPEMAQLSALLGESVQLLEREVGEKWQGQSGRWFTLNQQGHVVPTATPDAHDEPSNQKKKAAQKAAQAANQTMLGQLKAGAAKAFAAVKADTWDHLPEGLRGFVAGAYHLLESPRTKIEQLAVQIAKERGLPIEGVKRVAAIIAGASVLEQWVTNIPLAHHGAHEAGLEGGAAFALAKVGALVPVAALGYLAYATGKSVLEKNPLALLKAARKVLSQPLVHHEGTLDPDLLARLLERGGNEWYLALVSAALDQTGGDLARAMAAADAGFSSRPEGLSESKDAGGHEHKGAGEGGGQFTAGGAAGSLSDDVLGRADELLAAGRADREHAAAKLRQKAERKQVRQDIHAAARAAFGEGAQVEGDDVYFQVGPGREVHLEARPRDRSVFVEFTQAHVDTPSAKQTGQTGWDTTSATLQQGTVEFLHRFRAFIDAVGKQGVGVEYETTEPRRARLYARVLSAAGFTEAAPGSWQPPARVAEGRAAPVASGDLAQAHLAEARGEGEVWQGPSGHWFTIRQGRSVPVRAPHAGAAASAAHAQEVTHPKFRRAVEQFTAGHQLGKGQDAGKTARSMLANASDGERRALMRDLHVSDADHLPAELARHLEALVAPKEGAAPTPPAKPAPLQVHFAPALSETAKGVLRTGVAAGLARAKITDDQKKEYWDATQRVLGQMPEKAVKLLEPTRFDYAADEPDLKERIVGAFRGDVQDQVRADLAGQKGLGGVCMNTATGHLFLDGARTGAIADAATRNRQAVGAHEIYAHEISHRLDGEGWAHSSSAAWREAFAAELAADQLSTYASTEPSEGWAEFGRALYAGGHDLAAVQSRFPRCWDYWQAQGFTPEVKSG